MKFNQDLLIIALKILETTELTKSDDIKLFLSSLNCRYIMTDCQSWKSTSCFSLGFPKNSSVSEITYVP
jgi:hypothetical protein